jgi:protein required for attachment to host cells
MTLKIPHNAWILVGDGKKALFLRNDGDAEFPNLVTMDVMAQENPPTHEQGVERPGRASDGMGVNRSAVQQTDWHQLAEDRFAHDLAARLYQAAHAKEFEHLIVVAPPRTLGELRHSFHKEVQDRIVAEVDKTLTNHPVHKIEKLLVEKSG